jgi:hypothetical protein
MKKMIMKHLSMTALALVGAVITGCSSDNDIFDNPQQSENKSNVVTMTATISMDGGAQTRALNSNGVKTFAKDEKMALVYQNTSGTTVMVESAELKDEDIDEGSQSASFTFVLNNPDKEKSVTYIYPAAMAKNDGTVNYDALSTQDGTLTTLSSSLDLATKTAEWDGTSLPYITLDNQLAILALTLKNSDGTSEITGDITGMTLSDGTNNYTVTRVAAAGPIYVVIHPTNSADIEMTATTGTINYTKSLTGKTYAASCGYSLSLRMVPEAASVTTAPAAVGDDLTYTGAAQALITAGAATGGTLKYYVSTTENEPATTDEGWTETVPTGTDVGTYYVWYYVDGDANHTSTAVTAIEGGTKAIGKADHMLSTTVVSFGEWGTSTGSKTVTVCDNAGEVSATVTTGNTHCRVSVSGTTITITRLLETAFNATVTVTIAESENYNSTEKTISVSGTAASIYPMANEATSDHIGHVICNNGHIHISVAAATSAGCTASAMIAYVGSENGVDGYSAYSEQFNHGLAVALSDIKDNGKEGTGYSMTWPKVETAISKYSRARSDEYTTPWFLPSIYQWQRILMGCGGTTPFTTSLTIKSTFSYGNLRTLMKDCGGAIFQDSYYWSSTEYSSDGVWGYRFKDTKLYQRLKNNSKYNSFLRVFLAF